MQPRTLQLVVSHPQAAIATAIVLGTHAACHVSQHETSHCTLETAAAFPSANAEEENPSERHTSKANPQNKRSPADSTLQRNSPRGYPNRRERTNLDLIIHHPINSDRQGEPNSQKNLFPCHDQGPAKKGARLRGTLSSSEKRR
jgi:hypothetical protein